MADVYGTSSEQTIEATLDDSIEGAAGEWFSAGTSIGRYVVIQTLGGGGMGVVYAAYDPELDRKVALKLLQPDRLSTSDRRGSKRLLREAKAMARLNHPNVVTVHDVGTLGDQVFIAMEFVEGEVVTRWVASERRTWREVLAVYARAGRGLAAAHAAGLIHRDFKPDNVMIGRDERIRVMDFGLAREDRTPDDEITISEKLSVRLSAQSVPALQQLTAPGGMVGTPAYMAPEQHGGNAAGPRSDQFSFCVALYESLYGQRPFRGDTLAALALAICNGRIEPAPRKTSVPRWLRRVVLRGLATDPTQRFSSMRALLGALASDPAKTRRRVVVLGSVVVVAGGALGAVGLTGQRAIAACDRAGAAISETWNQAARREVRHALSSTGVSYAEPTWVSVEQRLTSYAHDWHSSRTEVCRAANVSGEWGDDLHALARDCLDERRTELAALVDVLREADASVVRMAVEAAGMLSALEPCAERARLLQRPPLPEQLDVRAVVVAQKRKLLRGSALAAAGKYAEGYELAREAHDSAREVGYPPLVIEALLRMSSADNQRGHYAAAETHAREAFFFAGKAGQDQLAARAASLLTYTVGHNLGRYEDGLEWGNHATMLLERMGSNSGLRAAMLLSNIGSVHSARNAWEPALRSYGDSLAIYEAMLGRDHPRVSAMLNNVGGALARGGSNAESVAFLRRALVARKRAYRGEHPHVAETMANLGITLLELGELDEAFELSREAVTMLERTLGQDHPTVAKAIVDLGTMLTARGQPREAAAHFLRAASIQERTLGPHDSEVAMALANAATAESELDAHDRAHRRYLEALAILEGKADADPFRVAYILHGLGVVTFVRGDYDAAEAYHTRVLTAFERRLGATHPKLASPLHGLGRAQLAARRFGDAAVTFERALYLHEATGPKSSRLDSARFFLAQALWESGTDRRRAAFLARRARDGFVAGGPKGAEGVEEVDAWLDDRGLPASDSRHRGEPEAPGEHGREAESRHLPKPHARQQEPHSEREQAHE